MWESFSEDRLALQSNINVNKYKESFIMSLNESKAVVLVYPQGILPIN